MFERKIFTEEQNFFRETVSKFIKKEIIPYHKKWEDKGVVSKELWIKAGHAGHSMMAGAGTNELAVGQGNTLKQSL